MDSTVANITDSGVFLLREKTADPSESWWPSRSLNRFIEDAGTLVELRAPTWGMLPHEVPRRICMKAFDPHTD